MLNFHDLKTMMCECVLIYICNFKLTLSNNSEYVTHGLPKTLIKDLFERLLCVRIDTVQRQKKKIQLLSQRKLREKEHDGEAWREADS